VSDLLGRVIGNSVMRGLNPSVRLWLLTWALAAFGYFGLQGVLFNLCLLRLGFGPEFIGLLVGSGQFIWALAAIPAAEVGRRVGLRTALLAGFVLLGVGFGLLLLVEALPRALWEPWLFGCWAVFWIGAALVTVNNVPYAMIIVDEQGRNAVFPVQAAVIAVMTFAGSLAAGAMPGLVVAWTGDSLDEAEPYRTALCLVPLLFLTCTLALAGARRARLTETPAQKALGTPRPLGTFLILGAIVLLQTAAEGPVRAFFNLYLDRGLGVPIDQIGGIIGLAQLLSVAGALLTVNLLARWGAARTLALGSIGTAVALLPLAGIPSVGMAALGFMGVMTMAAVHSPARNVFSQELVATRWRTTTAAILTVGTALGWASTAAAGGFVIAAVGFAGLFGLSAALAAGAAVLAWASHRLQVSPWTADEASMARSASVASVSAASAQP
jgi:MFS family permease